MNILICPDKFKGTLTAIEVAKYIANGCKAIVPDANIQLLPLADGGEGTLFLLSDIFSLEEIKTTVKDPLFRDIEASYFKQSKTAYIEMANASGLSLLKLEERNCMNTSTYGTGQLITHAVLEGAKEIYLFIGGSATNDAGIGMAEALGYNFFGKNGKKLETVGRNLIEIENYKRMDHSIDLAAIQFYVVTDVKNPLYGSNGAAYVYAGQKGATSTQIESLDRGLENFNRVVRHKTGQNVQLIAGTGAAGGLGGGGIVFLDAKILPGIETILEWVQFKKKLKSVDLVITGEGKFDPQTLQGKVVHGVYEICQKQKVPVAAVCGIVDIAKEDIERMNFVGIASLVKAQTSTKEAMQAPGPLIEKRVAELLQQLLP